LWQRGDEGLCLEAAHLPNVSIIEVPYSLSKGPNWARQLLQEQWRGEPYWLLLDSHHRFIPHWDSALRWMYSSVLSRSPRPVLSSYLPSFYPELDPRGRRHAPMKVYPYRRDSGVLSQVTSYPIPFWQEQTAPVIGALAGLHFMFGQGDLAATLKFNQDVYYLRDEIMASVQLFTLGYDIYHPHRVVGWHAYQRTTRHPHWVGRDSFDEQADETLRLMSGWFTGRVEPPAGLFGRERPISGFEQRAMVRLVDE
jgi:hypothetical protein